MQRNDEGEQTLNQLLACMDGIDTKADLHTRACARAHARTNTNTYAHDLGDFRNFGALSFPFSPPRPSPPTRCPSLPICIPFLPRPTPLNPNPLSPFLCSVYSSAPPTPPLHPCSPSRPPNRPSLGKRGLRRSFTGGARALPAGRCGRRRRGWAGQRGGGDRGHEPVRRHRPGPLPPGSAPRAPSGRPRTPPLCLPRSGAPLQRTEGRGGGACVCVCVGGRWGAQSHIGQGYNDREKLSEERGVGGEMSARRAAAQSLKAAAGRTSPPLLPPPCPPPSLLRPDRTAGSRPGSR